jgi:hypothetical protein
MNAKELLKTEKNPVVRAFLESVLASKNGNQAPHPLSSTYLHPDLPAVGPPGWFLDRTKNRWRKWDQTDYNQAKKEG